MSQFNFRTLEPSESRIIFIRHGKHIDNVLITEDVQKAHEIGKALKNSGLTFDDAFSSPAGRAVQTIREILVGMGDSMRPIKYIDGISDMKSESPAVVDKLKADAKSKGLKGDAGLAELGFDPDYGLLPLFVKRAWEGAASLVAIATKNPGKTIIAGSHGVSRMEITVQVLMKKSVRKPKEIIDRLGIVELIIDTNIGELNDCYWL